jgi:4-amino-4-deoxy-L-arabinose transferase-like glycosyltransferase
VVEVACVDVGAARSAPLVLGLALVLLLSIPWGYAVARHLANAADPPTE